MTWYAAHIISALKLIDSPQDSIPIWENIKLIFAANEEDAFMKAERLGKEDASIDDTVKLNDQPARWEYCGIRKLVEVSNPYQKDDVPGDKAEISYIEYSVNSDSEIEKILNGEKTNVLYE